MVRNCLDQKTYHISELGCDLIHFYVSPKPPSQAAIQARREPPRADRAQHVFQKLCDHLRLRSPHRRFERDIGLVGHRARPADTNSAKASQTHYFQRQMTLTHVIGSVQVSAPHFQHKAVAGESATLHACAEHDRHFGRSRPRCASGIRPARYVVSP